MNTTTELTTEQKNELIAKRCGWTVSGHGWWSHPTLTDGGGTMPDPPEYFNDLNACHEMEKVLSGLNAHLYANMLEEALHPALIDGGAGRTGAPSLAWQGVFEMLNAAAAQRAEAFGKALGLW